MAVQLRSLWIDVTIDGRRFRPGTPSETRQRYYDCGPVSSSVSSVSSPPKHSRVPWRRQIEVSAQVARDKKEREDATATRR